MTIRRDEDVVMLEATCPVEDAEILMQEVQAGAALLDWSGCSHLHTACLQVILVSRLPIRGVPANPALARWVGPILDSAGTPPEPLAPPTLEVAHQEES